MLRYVTGRIGQALLVVLGAYSLTFVAIQLLPGDPITSFIAANDLGFDEATIAQMKAYYGYDQGLIGQYLSQVSGLARCNLGYSITSGKPVTTELVDALGPTVQLSAVALVIAITLSGAIVTCAALSRSPRLRSAVQALPPLIASVPTFWLGLVVLQVLSFRLRVMSVFPDGSLLSLLVPATILAIVVSAPLSQVLLKSVTTALDEPFVKTVRAKGASARWVFARHVLKYSASSAVTIVGLMTGALLAGAVVTETVFSRPGLGGLLENSVSNQNLPLVQGFVLLSAVVYVVVNLVVDLLYPIIDPRVVTGGAPSSSR